MMPPVFPNSSLESDEIDPLTSAGHDVRSRMTRRGDGNSLECGPFRTRRLPLPAQEGLCESNQRRL